MPGFLLKIRQDSAQIFTKLSPGEELGTLETSCQSRVEKFRSKSFVINILLVI